MLIRYKIEFIDENGKTNILKNNLSLLAGEIIDASVLSKKALVSFFMINLKMQKKKVFYFPYT